jgi:two-component system, response regulator RegA
MSRTEWIMETELRHGWVVDDDAVFGRTLARALERRCLHCSVFADGDAVLQAARTQSADFLVLDLKLGQQSGLSLIEPLLELHPELRILLLTGYASVATAVEAMKRGAVNYLPKPASADAIVRALLDEEDELPELEDSTRMTPLARVEWEHIQQALVETGGNLSAAARLLGMHRRSLQRKLAKRPSGESLI